MAVRGGARMHTRRWVPTVDALAHAQTDLQHTWCRNDAAEKWYGIFPSITRLAAAVPRVDTAQAKGAAQPQAPMLVPQVQAVVGALWEAFQDVAVYMEVLKVQTMVDTPRGERPLTAACLRSVAECRPAVLPLAVGLGAHGGWCICWGAATGLFLWSACLATLHYTRKQR